MQRAADEVARLEIDKAVGAGPDRLQVRRRIARGSARVFFEQVLWNDHAALADKGVCPERGRLGKLHLDRQRIDLFDLDILVAADRRRRGRRIGGVLPIEHHIVGGKRLAVVPVDTVLQFPGHRFAVGRDAATLDIGDLGREDRRQVAVRVPGRERLIEHARAFLVLGPDRKMRIEQGRALPEQRLEGSAAAGLGRLVRARGRGLRQADRGQQLGCDRCRKPGAGQSAHKRAPGQPAFFDPGDQLAQFPLVHSTPLAGVLSRRCSGARRRPAAARRTVLARYCGRNHRLFDAFGRDARHFDLIEHDARVPPTI